MYSTIVHAGVSVDQMTSEMAGTICNHATLERSETGITVIGIVIISTDHLHKQGCSNGIKPQSLSPPQTRDQATQYIDESGYQLQSCSANPSSAAKPSFSAKPSPTAEPSLSTESSPSAESLTSSNISRCVCHVTIHNDETETYEYVDEDSESLIEVSQYLRKAKLSQSQSSES